MKSFGSNVINIEKGARHTKPIVFILSAWLKRFPYVRFSLDERFIGLYNTFSDVFSSDYDIYLYDEARMKLYRFTNGEYKTTNFRFLPSVILRLLQKSIRYRKKFLLVISYPYACYLSPFIASFILLFTFKPLNFIKIVLDVVDVPTYPEREIKLLDRAVLDVMEVVCLKLASCVMVNSNGWREYFVKRKVKCKIQVVPWGSFHRLIKPAYRSSGDVFNLLYAGAIVQGRGIEELVECIRRARKKCDIRLIFATGGVSQIHLPKSGWLQKFSRVPNYLNAINKVNEGFAKNINSQLHQRN